ncbi:MAG: hypothetical protein Q8873_03085 [Bacillota bacterium]|nr:hypothetical protein [Bacillota bacterium]
MGALIIIGIVWVIWQIIKEAGITQVPKDTDFRQVFIDSHSGKYSNKQMNKRVDGGEYVKKDE